MEQPFAGLLGHERVKRQLMAMVEQSRLPHALLFSGPDGVGKRSLALRLAAHLLQGALSLEEALQRIERRNHPDFMAVEPQGPLALHPIESVRAIQELAQLEPYEAPYKLFFVTEAERMAPGSSNALLKCFEEPPSHTLIFLISSHPQAILPTVASRCQQLRFGAASVEELAQFLSEHHQLPTARAEELALLARGSFQRAEQLAHAHEDKAAHLLLEQLAKGPFPDYQRLQAWVEQLCQLLEGEKKESSEQEASHQEQLIASELLSKAHLHERERLRESHASLYLDRRLQQLLEQLISWYRDMALLRSGAPHRLLWNRAWLPAIDQAIQRGEERLLHQVIEATESARRSLMRSTPLSRCLERLFLQIHFVYSP